MLPFEVIRTGHLLFVRNEETQSRLNLATSRSFYDSHPYLFERALVSNGVWSHDLEHNLQILIVEANTHKNFHKGLDLFPGPNPGGFGLVGQNPGIRQAAIESTSQTFREWEKPN
jgi:hypothetical protein